MAIAAFVLLTSSGRLAAHANDLGAGNVLGQGAFISRATGVRIILRGNDFATIVQDAHQTLQPGVFSLPAVALAFTNMHNSGYNFVRITLDCTDLMTSKGVTGAGFSAGFLGNLVTLLATARQHGLYVVLTMSDLPLNYRALVVNDPRVGSGNADVMNPSSVSARASFWVNLLAAIKPHEAAYSAIIGLDIRNEATLSVSAAAAASAPFSASTGAYAFNGRSYSLAMSTTRQALADDETKGFLDVIARAIKIYDSQMLVGLSIYTPSASGRPAFNGLAKDNANAGYPLAPLAILQSNADFLDLHTYPSGSSYSIDTDFASAQLSSAVAYAKPLYIGEYGALKLLYPTTALARSVLVAQIAGACRYGFSGFALYTWDGVATGVWNAVESNGSINAAVSPAGLPVPCADIPNSNFIATINGVGAIYASNGSHFCWYDTWALYLRFNHNNPNVSYMKTYNRIPLTMIYDGVCGG
ncbi:hypothetical protein [Lichenicoccus sp.]|uniref:hypothetical protein n=1 Tax=Lichenicoccus sp. TaxID=2781899 RepID=UPI003D0D0635